MKRVLLTMAWAMCLGCGASNPNAGVSLGGNQDGSSAAAGGSSSGGMQSSSETNPPDASTSAPGAFSGPAASGSSAEQPSSLHGASSAGASSQGGPSSGSVVVPNPGETCLTATEVSGEQMVINQTTAGYLSDYDSANRPTCLGGAAPDRVYRVTVPAQHRVDVTVTPETDFDPAVNLLAGDDTVCAAPSACDVGVDVGTSGDAEHATYVNPGSQPVNVFIMVDGFQGSAGRFTLQTQVAAVEDGDACATAPTVTSGTTMNQTTTGFSSQNDSDANMGCKGGTAPDRVYRVEVPAGQRLTVSATPENSFDLALNVLAGPGAACGAAAHACLAATDGHAAGGVETLVHDNTTGAPEELFVVVDGFLDGAGRFALNVQVGPPPEGDTCHNAETLALPGMVTGTTVGFQDNVSAHRSCTGFSNDGPDHIYKVTLPPHAQVALGVHSTTEGFDPSLYVLAGPEVMCDAVPLVCLAGADVQGDDVVQFTNTHDTTQEVFVVVDAVWSDGGGYTLSASLL